MNDVGSAAEEAVKLFAAMEDWARRKASHVLDEEHISTGSAECQMCPVCQGIGVLRHVRPEAVEHMLDAAASFVAALKTAVSTPPPDEPGRRAAKVQHISVGEPE
ncbi:MAG: hypothetical protein QOE05_1763 [Actinomycetota bacterium]|nr:hypothetical protein [Actinomycetota bacterium]